MAGPAAMAFRPGKGAVMVKHIGIVACSAEGAALCYRTICAEAAARMGEHSHPEITMHTHALAKYMAPIRSGEWDRVAELMLSSARIVAAAGAQFAICPDNTIHQAFDRVQAGSPIPWLHIARVVAAQARAAGHTTVCVLGTKYLMSGPVYREALAACGIEQLVPDEPDREQVNRIIFDELVRGVFTDASRRCLNQVMARLRARGATAVVLGCTEIPLLVRPEESPLPTLDSTRLLARAALDFALTP
jgi:aspartate racemase